MNERITETLVRNNLKELGYYDNPALVVEEQISKHPKIKRLLKHASKSGEGRGRPEFIIRERNGTDTVIIIECKANKKHHNSDKYDQPAQYAIDGALHYASFLSKDFKVIAIGVSGEENPIVNMFLCVGEHRQILKTNLLTWQDFQNLINFNPKVQYRAEKQLLQFSNLLHNYIRDHLKLSESQKPLLVGACLVALSNRDYRDGVDTELPARQQIKKIQTAIESELEKAKINPDKIKTILQPLNALLEEKALQSSDGGIPAFNNMLDMLYSKVKPLFYVNQGFDLLGHFYAEFLSYTAGDKKALGIVLTPQHITELFTELGEVNKNSVVLDTCTGTGGFLIAAMAKMISKAEGDTKLINSIKGKQLVGVEYQSNMFALACFNMMLKGDGKANIYNGSCFSVSELAKQHKATVGLLNPPYAQKATGLTELHFIENNLDCLQPGGLSVSIVPLSVAITGNLEHRREVMAKHTLRACMTAPPEIFPNVGVHTCIMVWEAHKPHDPEKKSWFALWKDDGFIKTKTKGRCDYYNQWPAIRKQWLTNYFNKTVKPGYSTMQSVDANSEWCCEAYLEPNYSEISYRSYLATIRQEILEILAVKVDEVLQ